MPNFIVYIHLGLLTMNDKELLEERLATLSPAVERNAEIVVPNEDNNGYMLHISTNTNIKEFIPIIGFRQAKSEDRTVPRICVAPHLLGCLLGYAAVEQDFHNSYSNQESNKDKKKSYKGGYKIYGFEFGACLKPNKKLVYDADCSDEHWLVNYSEETTVYKPIDLGRIFVRAITYRGAKDEIPDSAMEMYIEIKNTDKVRFSKNLVLEKGYYRIDGPGEAGIESWKKDKDFNIVAISRSDYLSAKNACADMLSLTEGIPNYLKW